MKLIITIILTFLSLSASAQYIDCRHGVNHRHPACSGGHYHYNHNHQHRHIPPPVVVYKERDWVAPVIGGLVLGAVITEAARSRNNEPTVTIETRQEQSCTEWRHVVQSDGTIVRERTCYNR